jgi:hypothetical protein
MKRLDKQWYNRNQFFYYYSRQSTINDGFPNLVPNSSSSFMTGKNIPLAGIAFAGDRGITKVEVSADGGNTWKTAS